MCNMPLNHRLLPAVCNSYIYWRNICFVCFNLVDKLLHLLDQCESPSLDGSVVNRRLNWFSGHKHSDLEIKLLSSWCLWSNIISNFRGFKKTQTNLPQVAFPGSFGFLIPELTSRIHQVGVS
jgi:hypothetical protein